MALTGNARRILIVEDETLLAMHLEDMLTELGHEVVGMATRVKEASVLARDLDIDLAVLDVNIAGGLSFPVADVLRARNIPFVFATGYGIEGVLEGYKEAPTLRKPYELQDLQSAIATCDVPADSSTSPEKPAKT